MLIVPGRRFLGIGHPQGIVPAPVGHEYWNEQTGIRYQKLGGGSTPFGWYRDLPPADVRGTFFRSAVRGSGTLLLTNVGQDQGTVVGGLAGNIFPEGTALDTYRPWKMAYTSAAAAGAVVQFRPATNTNSAPAIIGQDNLNNELGWDWWADIRTTPRPSAASAATDLLNNRIMCGVLVWSTAVVGAPGNSDTFNTFWGGVGVGGGLWGICFRYSTAAADPGWQVVSANENGVVWSQTVTNLATPIAANTTYRLRLRYVVADATVYASIDDGTETAVTLNVGPGVNVSAIRMLQTYLVSQTLAAAFKSLGCGGIFVDVGSLY